MIVVVAAPATLIVAAFALATATALATALESSIGDGMCMHRESSYNDIMRRRRGERR